MNYIQELAQEIRAAVPEDVVPDDSEYLFLIYAVLARSKGEATTKEDVHDAWTAWMLSRGETHESMRPYIDLASETRKEDEPFVQAIHQVSERK